MEHHNLSRSKVSRETFDTVDQIVEDYKSALSEYLEQLWWWNKRINLVSRDVSRETVWEHVRHSLLLKELDCYKKENLVLDSGTGGGLPGIPLAITSPDKHFILNDIVMKKCLAIKQMVKKIGLSNVTILEGSIEDIRQDDPFLLISKHAFKINDLYGMTAHLPWTKMVFYKGSQFEEELSGIDEALSIRQYDLSDGGEFYMDKSLIVIERI